MRIFKNFFILQALNCNENYDSRNIKQSSVIFLQGENCNVFQAWKFVRKTGELRRSLTLVNALFSRKKLGSSFVQSVSEEAYASVLHCVHSRPAYGETEFAAIRRLLEGVLAEELRQNNASFHARCGKRLLNSALLKCAEARFEKAAASQNTSFLSHPPGRPSLASHTGCYFPSAFHGLTEQTSRRIPRSSTASFSKKLCFFCQSHDDKQDVHAIQIDNRRRQL